MHHAMRLDCRAWLVHVQKCARSHYAYLESNILVCMYVLWCTVEIFLTNWNAALGTTSTWTYGDHCSPIISSIKVLKNLRKTIVVCVVDSISITIALNFLFWPEYCYEIVYKYFHFFILLFAKILPIFF